MSSKYHYIYLRLHHMTLCLFLSEINCYFKRLTELAHISEGLYYIIYSFMLHFLHFGHTTWLWFDIYIYIYIYIYIHTHTCRVARSTIPILILCNLFVCCFPLSRVSPQQLCKSSTILSWQPWYWAIYHWYIEVYSTRWIKLIFHQSGLTR